MMKLIVSLQNLLKTGTGVRQLISKQQQGDRMVYMYMQPDGSTKMVTKKINPKKLRPNEKQEKSTQVKQKSQKDEDAGNKAPVAQQASPAGHHKYSSLPEGEYIKKIFPGGGQTQGGSEKSETGIPLLWRVHYGPGAVAYVMSGQKFRLSIIEHNGKSEGKSQYDVRVEAPKAGKNLYAKKITLMDKFSLDDPETSSVSILAPCIEELGKYNGKNHGGLGAIKYSLEKKYFVHTSKDLDLTNMNQIEKRKAAESSAEEKKQQVEEK